MVSSLRTMIVMAMESLRRHAERAPSTSIGRIVACELTQPKYIFWERLLGLESPKQSEAEPASPVDG